MNMDAQGAFEMCHIEQKDLEVISKAFSGAEDVGLNYFDIDEKTVIQNTLKQLEKCGKYEDLGAKNGYILKALGKEESKTANISDRDYEKLKNTATAVITSADSVEFILCKKDETIKFIIVGENLKFNNTESILRAEVDYAEISACSIPSVQYKECGFLKCVNFDTHSKHSDEKNEMINWVDSIISANINSDYIVSIKAKTADKIKIQEKIEQLSACYKELEKLNEVTKNISFGNNNSQSKNQNVITTTIGKGNTVSGGTNMSIALSQIQRVSAIKHLTETVEKKISELTQALVGGLKNITICCSTEDILDFQTLTAIIKSYFIKQGYEAKWINGHDEEPAIEILYKDIPKFFCLPGKDFPGFERREKEELAVNSADENGELNLGNIYWNGSITDKKFTMQLEKLNRHISVFGMTGSGKSNTVFSLLEQSKVPFMVIEPVKGEYRTLKKTYADMVVYHMEADKEGVLQINPFWFPMGGSLSFHMDALKKIISSAFSLYAAMPNILEQCIYNCYVKKGWNVVKSTNVFVETIPEEYLYPTFSDLCNEIELYLQKSDFQGETLSTYKGALLSRLKSFTTGSKGVLLNTTKHPEFDKWRSNNYVVELDGLADDADKSIVMGSLIMQYFQNVKKSKQFTTELKHIIIVEEAHRLFKNNTTQNYNQEVAAPEAQLVGTLSNMLAEIRAYGEGFIIVDQSPNKVSEDVVSNSSTKIVHRLDNKKDIDMIENSLLMKDMSTVISGLTRGDAIIRTEGMMKPTKVKINKSNIKDSNYVYKQNNDSAGLDNASNVDFIMNNDEFCNEFIQLTRKFINQLLYDDLNNSSTFFKIYMQYLNKLLYLSGFSEIAENADKRFFLLLVSEGVKKTLSQSNMKQIIFTLQMRMFADRLCEILADGHITRKEIAAFNEFRATVLYEHIAIKNKNSGTQEQGIAVECGFHTIYTDILTELMILINDKEVDFENPENLTVNFFEKTLSNVWKEIFITEPEKIIKYNIVLLLRMLYLSVLGKNNE